MSIPYHCRVTTYRFTDVVGFVLAYTYHNIIHDLSPEHAHINVHTLQPPKMVQWREHQTWYNGGNTKHGTMEGTPNMVQWREHQTWYNGGNTKHGTMEGTPNMVQWREHQTWYNGGNTKHGTMEGTPNMVQCG